MAGSYPSQLNPGSMIALRNIFSPSYIQGLDPNTNEFKSFLVKLNENINNIAFILNTSAAGYFPLTEYVNNEIYFPDPSLSSSTPQAPVWRQVFRNVVNFGALPNTATKSVAHGLDITSGYSVVHLYGGATNPSTSFIPLPFVGAAGGSIELNFDATNVNIITTDDKTAYTRCFVVMEYIKS